MGYNDDKSKAGCLAAIIASIGIIGLWVLFSIIFAWPVQLLWNWLVPTLFSGPEITLWQALGLEVLSGLLLRSSSTINNNNYV